LKNHFDSLKPDFERNAGSVGLGSCMYWGSAIELHRSSIDPSITPEPNSIGDAEECVNSVPSLFICI